MYRSGSASRQRQPALANGSDLHRGVAEALQTLVALPVQKRMNVSPRVHLSSLHEALEQARFGVRLESPGGCIRRAEGKGAHDRLHFIRRPSTGLLLSLRWGGLVNCSNL